MYSVYIHTCPNGKKYVGMTSREPKARWKSGHGYEHCTDFYSAIIEYGWRNISHEVVKTGLERAEAEELERALIAYYNTTDPKYGYNSHSGGLKGAKINQTTKSRMSLAQSREKNPRYGAVMTAETKEKISASKKGKALTEEHKKVLSELLSGEKNPAARPVFQYDLDMNLIKEWPYVRAAMAATGAHNIWACCVGNLKTSGGYIWRYERIHDEETQ